MTKTPLAIAAAAALALTASVALTNAAEARDQIRIVGSSTVFPFSTAVAEEFGKTTGHKTPVVESTGSGGGLKLFCAGVGVAHPDITNSSRRIKASEVERCAENGVTDITEVKIGYDGIVLANSKSAERFSITLQQLFLALAKDGSLRRWDGAQSQPDLERHRRLPAGREDRGARPAADLRHAGRLRRARHGGRLQDLPRHRGDQERGQERLQGHLPLNS